jgi:hypothetical protein
VVTLVVNPVIMKFSRPGRSPCRPDPGLIGPTGQCGSSDGYGSPSGCDDTGPPNFMITGNFMITDSSVVGARRRAGAVTATLAS